MADAPEEWETAESNLSCFAYQYYHRATGARDKPGFLCFPILPTGHGRTRQIWVALHTSITNRPQPHVKNLSCFAYRYYNKATGANDKPGLLCFPALAPGHELSWQTWVALLTSITNRPQPHVTNLGSFAYQCCHQATGARDNRFEFQHFTLP